MINVVVFEDQFVTRLFPITTGRMAMSITCGTRRLYDWLLTISPRVRAVVRPYLTPILRADYPQATCDPDTSLPYTVLINARVIPSPKNFQQLCQLVNQSRSLAIRNGSLTVAAVMPTSRLAEVDWDADSNHFSSQVDGWTASLDSTDAPIDLFEYPHDVVRHHLSIFNDSIEQRISQREYREIADGVFVQGDVTISDYVVTNTKSGPIVIDEDTAIGPFCFLRGPVHIGRNSRVSEHAAIKDCVSIGHTCKIGGEVEGSVIEPYTNKQHHGFLGHSYLGSWINLGAGTCNSDLKNTYGEVKMDYGSGRVATGMQFIGCIVGDFAKTAINTSIFTGKTIGVCSMVYGFVTTNVPSFVNYARSFGQITESPPLVMEATQRRMFGRRNVQQRPIDIQLIRDMYELTRNERQLSEEPLSL